MKFDSNRLVALPFGPNNRQNHGMSRSSLASRIAVWAAVCALILRAGVPLLAAGAAQLRGVPVASVCEVYGVAMPGMSPSQHAGHAHHHDGHSSAGSHSDDAHTSDHCALTALGTLASSSLTAIVVSQAHALVPDLSVAASGGFPDACATWAARRKQGPPSSA